MAECYCANAAVETAVGNALEFYGLEADPRAVNRRPSPARTLAEQFRRIDIGGKVLSMVRRSVPVGWDDRQRIERLVDSACQRIEDQERPRTPKPTDGATAAVVVAYAAAGGGTFGSFESFARTFVSDSPVFDRQDVQPPPMTSPVRRRGSPAKGPGTAAPAKTNPTRTVRSSRWSSTRKAVKP